MQDNCDLPPDMTLLFEPNISINGLIEQSTVTFFLDRLTALRQGEGPMIMELNTNGGDADAARRIALEVKLFLRHHRRGGYCVGKTNIYSAGVTIMAAFPRTSRFMTEDAILLVHERRLEDSIELKGPMRSCLQIVREQLAMLETAEKLEKQGFHDLIEGSLVTEEQIYEHATNNCYIPAEKAKALRLIADVLR
jgi:ATP-dependent protease ClpP protease subunit